MTISVLALNCTLKRGNAASSTDVLLKQVLREFEDFADATTELVRVANLTILPGVTSDEGEGDEWPELRQKIIEADVLLLGTPIWMGQPSSICKRVMERMDAFLSETDDKGHMPAYGKCVAVAVVGNEDGAHHVSAEIFQALNDVGFSIPPNAITYWVGEAMSSTDYKDVKQIPEAVAKATSMVVRNSTHLARLMQQKDFPNLG